jgi:hypothetical protein
LFGFPIAIEFAAEQETFEEIYFLLNIALAQLTLYSIFYFSRRCFYPFVFEFSKYLFYGFALQYPVQDDSTGFTEYI